MQNRDKHYRLTFQSYNQSLTSHYYPVCDVSLLPEDSTMKITAIEVVNAVCEHYNLEFKDVVGISRTEKLVDARSVAVYLIDALCTDTYREDIANLFSRDMDSIYYTIRKVRKIINTTVQHKILNALCDVYVELQDTNE